DNFHILFNEQYNPNSLRSGYYETWFDRAHNTVMDVISMTGIVGLLTFLALWGGIYYTVITAKRKKYIDMPTTAVLIGLPAAYFLQNLFVFDHPAAFSMSYLLYAFIICIGFSGFANTKSAAIEADPKVKSKSIPWVSLGIVQVVFLTIVFFASYVPAKASAITIKFNNAFSSGSFDQAYVYAKEASEMSTPYLEDQTYLYAKNMIALADAGKLSAWPKSNDMIKITMDVNEQLLKIHDNNAHPRFIYANFLQSMARATQNQDYYDQAEEQYKKAIDLSKKRQQLYFSYGRLLIERGRLNEAMSMFKQAAAFDEQVGESWWYVAVSYEFDQQKPDEAAPYYKKAYEAEYPYGFRNAQDAWFVAKAYERLNEPEGVKKIIENLPNLPAAPAAVYIQIASVADRMGLLDERNLILGAVFKLDPTAKTQLEALVNGEVETIDEALSIYNAKTQAVNNQNIDVPTSDLMVVTSSEVLPTSTKSSGTGPRL
ncbi:tetratricopeptide repeat protein, partial [Patescibacteria group bacterium]|nr:tetratricopeptide repeat protein [Patescibacteria group bacterium]